MNEYAMNMREDPVDPLHSFDAIKMSVPSPLSEYILNGSGSQPEDEVFTPIDTVNAATSDVTISSGGTAGEELSEDKLKQIKRAQNRAAQRAFRERKEKRLKELEQELRQSEVHRKQLDQELERLSKANLEMNAEKKMLLEQGTIDDYGTQGKRFTFPNETDHEHFGSLEEARRYRLNLIQAQGHYYDEAGKEILTIPATWDYFHKLSEQLPFNVAGVLDNLKGKQVCHGLGAAYPRTLVDQLVQEQYIKDAGCA